MSYVIAPSVRAGLAEATRRWPPRERGWDGTIGDAAHASRSSDHNPAPEPPHYVHAFDLTNDPMHGCDNDINSAHLIKVRDPRVKYIIWRRRIWNPSISLQWRPYGGSNPHDHHMHVSIRDGYEKDLSPWWDNTQAARAPVEVRPPILTRAPITPPPYVPDDEEEPMIVTRTIDTLGPQPVGWATQDGTALGQTKLHCALVVACRSGSAKGRVLIIAPDGKAAGGPQPFELQRAAPATFGAWASGEFVVDLESGVVDTELRTIAYRP